MKGAFLLCGWLVAGCGGMDAGGGMDADVGPPLDPALQRRVDDAIDSIRADTCFTQDDTSQCLWDDYEIAPKFIMRGTISSAVARPGFQQITAAISLSPSTNSISQGNPA